MYRITSVNNARMAQAFIDYMDSRGIHIEMSPEGDGQVSLWLEDIEHQSEVEAEWKFFLSNPNAKRYQAASWDLAESRQRQFHYSSPNIINMITAKAGPVTLTIMLLCVVVFLLQQINLNHFAFNLLHFPSVDGEQWQVWRWFSHALLHFSFLHITFNLLWWWQLGSDIEQKLGGRRLLILFVVSASLSGYGQYWVEGANFGGLSGVVYALVGYLWMLGARAPRLNLGIPKPILAFMLIWLVLGFVQPFLAIANTAHLVGLVSGVLLGIVDAHRYQK